MHRSSRNANEAEDIFFSLPLLLAYIMMEGVKMKVLKNEHTLSVSSTKKYILFIFIAKCFPSNCNCDCSCEIKTPRVSASEINRRKDGINQHERRL